MRTDKDISSIKEAYFVGIGGIGMSALARYLNHLGVKVSGYDKTASRLTDQLMEEGIQVHFEDDPELLPDHPELVVYTPAIPKDHQEMKALRERGIEPIKRSALLGRITRENRAVAVAGTHGKTTISSMIAHLLQEGEHSPTAFLGGIALNYNSNVLIGEGDWVVVEADEYDRSFLQLSPDIAVVTAVDPDHLDIYGNAEAMEEAFRAFAEKLPENGLLICHHQCIQQFANINRRILTYGLEERDADAYASDIQVTDGKYQANFYLPGREAIQVEVGIGGRHNLENALVAAVVAAEIGVNSEQLILALQSFKGIYRRFQLLLKDERCVYIDDYAHHPAELKALISSVREMYPTRKLTIIFQPHLYSRTRDFADGFAEALDLADRVILLPIYPARELPIKGVDSGMILERMKNEEKDLIAYDTLLEHVINEDPELLVTSGAGDIDRLVEPILERLSSKSREVSL